MRQDEKGPDVLLVDIGAGTGALVVSAPAELDGAELEITRAGRPGARPAHDHPEHDHPGHDHPGHNHPGHDHPGHNHPVHNVVRPRRTQAGVVFAAVFPDLPAGDYVAHGGWAASPSLVRVRGGEVTEVAWRPDHAA